MAGAVGDPVGNKHDGQKDVTGTHNAQIAHPYFHYGRIIPEPEQDKDDFRKKNGNQGDEDGNRQSHDHTPFEYIFHSFGLAGPQVLSRQGRNRHAHGHGRHKNKHIYSSDSPESIRCRTAKGVHEGGNKHGAQRNQRLLDNGWEADPKNKKSDVPVECQLFGTKGDQMVPPVQVNKANT